MHPGKQVAIHLGVWTIRRDTEYEIQRRVDEDRLREFATLVITGKR
jgi:hypothetical protein